MDMFCTEINKYCSCVTEDEFKVIQSKPKNIITISIVGTVELDGNDVNIENIECSKLQLVNMMTEQGKFNLKIINNVEM